MGLSAGRYQKHLNDWMPQLSNFRKIWLARLFRHEPFENAIQVINQGVLLSRNAAQGRIENDIAPEGIVNTNDHAHDKVRLYFRPRNPTQYHIEGIRKPAEYFQNKHAGILVMFVFEAEKILTESSTKFSDGNMQNQLSNTYDSDAGFDSLNFKHIYHDSFQNDSDITRARCAEVLVFSPLKLDSCLEVILVKSPADRNSLIHALSDEARVRFVDKIRVVKKQGVFFSHYSGVEYVDVAGGKLKIKLASRKDGGTVMTQFSILDEGTNAVLQRTTEWAADTSVPWNWKHQRGPGRYLFRADLEGTFAYEAFFVVSD